MTIPLWVGAALIGALAQTGRNATQAGLTVALGTLGATQVRFLFGLPFAILFLFTLSITTGTPVPGLTSRALGFATLGALSQIAGTALMLQVMRSQAFGVTTAWLKIEPVMVALIGVLVLGDHLTLGQFAAIGLAVAGVTILTLRPGGGLSMLRETGPAALGLMAGLAFGIAAIGFRGGIVALESGDFLMRAMVTLVLSLAIQSATLLVWMLVANRSALIGSFKIWRSSLGAGFLGALASAGWFTGFALTSAANVRTFALIEVVFAQLVARFYFRQSTTTRQLIGMAVILSGVGLLLRLQG